VSGGDVTVGDVVSYSAYGLGRVVGRRQRTVGDALEEVVVLEFADGGLTVSLPLERAREQLRALASETEIGKVQQTLREQCPLSEESWLVRQRNALAKLKGGDPLELAEIVRDGAARKRAATNKGKRPELPPGENQVFLRARELLAYEIGHVRGLASAEATDWVDRQLAET
jgi:CarD family transcriptional regulator